MSQLSKPLYRKKALGHLGRMALAFMAAALCFLGSMQPVFASESESWKEPFASVHVLGNGSNNELTIEANTSRPSNGTCINQFVYQEDVSMTSDGTSGQEKAVYDGATFHIPIKTRIVFNGFQNGYEYLGNVRVPLNVTFSSGWVNWNIKGVTLFSAILPVNCAISSSGSSYVLDIDLNGFGCSVNTWIFECNFVFEVTLGSTTGSYNDTHYSFNNLNSVNVLTSISNVGSALGNVYRSNATVENIANLADLRMSTVILNQETQNTWLSNLYSQQIALFNRLNVLLTNGNTSIGSASAGEYIYQTFNKTSQIRTFLNTIHDDLVTVHNDLTAADQTLDAAKDTYESAANEKDAIESSFAAEADPDQIIQDYDVILDDNRMNVGELAEGTSFWYTLTERFFNSAEDVNAEYPFLLQVFLNMLGRLW